MEFIIEASGVAEKSKLTFRETNLGLIVEIREEDGTFVGALHVSPKDLYRTAEAILHGVRN